MNIPRVPILILAVFSILPSFVSGQANLREGIRDSTGELISAEDYRDYRLRAWMPNFRRLPTRTSSSGDVEFQTITFNESPIFIEDKRYDGFRMFLGRAHQMNSNAPGFAWVLEVPDNVEAWYILSSGGKTQGFKNFSKLESGKVIQGLPYGALEAGKDYMIWFRFSDDRPVKITFGYKITEVEGNADGTVSGAELLKILFPSQQ